MSFGRLGFLGAGVGRLGGGGAAGPLDFVFGDGPTSPIYGPVSSPSSLYVSSTATLWVFEEGWTGTSRVVNVRTKNMTTGVSTAKTEVSAIGMADDDHGVPSCVRDSDGYVYVFHGGHSTVMYVTRTANPDDPSLWVELPLINNSYAYPHVHLVGSTIYAFFREIDGSSNYFLSLRSATFSAGTLTWGSNTRVATYVAGERFYIGSVITVGTDIYIVGCRADATNTFRKDIHLIIYDTVTGGVRNMDSSSTIASGSFPVANGTLNTSYRLIDQSTGGTNGGQVPAMTIDTDGHPHILYYDGVIAGGGQAYKHIMHNGAAWTSPATVGQYDVSDTVYRGDQFDIVALPGGEVEAYWATKPVNVTAFTRGGDLSKRRRSAAAVWGSTSVVRNAGTYAIDSPNAVRNGTAAARIMACEIFGVGSTSPNEAGDLKTFVYGDTAAAVKWASQSAAQAALNAFLARLSPAATGTDLAALSAYFLAVYNSGVDFDCYYEFAVAQQQWANLNWFGGSYALSPVAAPTWTAYQGYGALNGTNQTLNSQYTSLGAGLISTAAGAYKQVNASFAIGSSTTGQTAGTNGADNAGTFLCSLECRNTSNQFRFRVNDNSASVMTNTDGKGLFIACRLDASTKRGYMVHDSDGVLSQQDFSVAASGVPTTNPFHFGNVTTVWDTRIINTAFVGGLVTPTQAAAIAAARLAYRTAVGAT